jgi:hypothetical protein
MATLSTLLGKLSESTSVETNLEQGQVYAYTQGTQSSPFHIGIEFRHFTACGTAEIEVWGASGSGSRMCCCGIGLPGNPGAYSKKVVRVNPSSFLCFQTGMSCGNASTLCMRGCSEATCMTLCTLDANNNNTCSCICAQGGMAGQSYCTESCSVMCRYMSCNNCATQIGSAGCGIICNYGTSYSWIPSAYGGDINCSGGFSCLTFLACNSCCICYATAHVTTSAGVFSLRPQQFEYKYEPNGDKSQWNNSVDQYFRSLGAMTKSPVTAMPMSKCYSSNQYCGCYEYQGCNVMVAPGIPGHGGTPCSSVRDHGMRGGHGGVKIKFIPNS